MEGGRENRGDFDAIQFGALAFPRFAALLPLLAAKLPLPLLFGPTVGVFCKLDMPGMPGVFCVFPARGSRLRWASTWMFSDV